MRNADNLPPFCAIVTKSGNLNFLEPSGPLHVCNGTTLPLPLTHIYVSVVFLKKTDKFAASVLRNACDVTTGRRKQNCLKIDPFQYAKLWFLIPYV